MDNNKKLFEGLLKADGIDPANITESERMVFRGMLAREEKRMKYLCWLTNGAILAFSIVMVGLIVSEKILDTLHIPFVVGWLAVLAAAWFVIIRYMPGHNKKLRESNKKISKLYYLVHGKHRGLILIGKKDGKRFIYWPRIIMIAVAIWLFVSLAGAGVYYLLCRHWIFSSVPWDHIFLCTVMSLSFVIFLLREGLKAPLEELVEMKAKSKQSKPGSRPDVCRIIMKSKITKFAAAAVIIIAVLILIGISQFGGSIDMASVAWGEVIQKVQESPVIAYRCTKIVPQGGLGSAIEEHLVYTSSKSGIRIDEYSKGVLPDDYRIIIDKDVFPSGDGIQIYEDIDSSYGAVRVTMYDSNVPSTTQGISVDEYYERWMEKQLRKKKVHPDRSWYIIPGENIRLRVRHSFTHNGKKRNGNCVQKKLTEDEFVEWYKYNDPREWVKAALSLPYKKLGRDSIGETEVEGVEIEGHSLGIPPLFRKPTNAIVRIWVDIKTSLPVRYEAVVERGAGVGDWCMVADEFQWSVEPSDDVFEPNIPDDYTWIEE